MIFLFLLFFGILLGIFTGLVPGIHSNTVISILSTFDIDQIYLIIIMIIPAHMIVSFIPSIFFGIPEQGTVISVLPGHRMTLEGKGLLALKTVILSILLATLISVIMFPISLDLFPTIYSLIQPYIKYIVLGLSIIFVVKTKNPILSLGIFLLAGALGYVSLHSNLEDPFLPLFSGMFAIPIILNYTYSTIKKQNDPQLNKFEIRYVIIGVVGGFLSDLLPGISSPSQVATFFSIFMPINSLGYLSTIASISTSQTIFALSTAASIGKARIGGVAWLEKFIDIRQNNFELLVFMFFSVAITCGIVYLMRKKIASIANMNLSKLNILLAVYLTSIIFILNGFFGLAIFVVSGLLGYLTVRIGVTRTNLMGAVIVPTLMLLFRVFI